ncbi:PIN domain-containing protein [Hymenobacter sp. H14-R3]|uniref:PIN domain-containing protein n=1 Tax=Hymenobacter sp. H14-R3 TaxID=3046308 RepID=UPI0024BB5345|nr:PIN domain-containing protein [Hymenobacter sp. H14-R3]MDJ0366774.1 PIN domain-containing protein [Hymenobacter sp. H14-R3]
MKNLFPGHYKRSKAEFRELWESAIFAFDTNVLLDFFRYSDDTVEDLMATIEKVKDRIWIPYQVAAEYHKLLYNIIGEQAGHYSTAIKDLSALRATLDAKRKHPFVSKEVYTKADETFKVLEKELKEKQEKVISLLNENPIKDKLAILFSDKIGEPFDEKSISKLYTEGELRYAKLIPPGYEDAKKPSPDKFGDLIIWKQLIKYAKEVDKAIIFITGDTKDDWFLSQSGKIIGPRPELLAEFVKETNQTFYSYPTTAFLKSANDFLSAGVKKATLDEVKSFDESSNKYRNEGNVYFEHLNPLFYDGNETKGFPINSSIRISHSQLEEEAIKNKMRYLKFRHNTNSASSSLNNKSFLGSSAKEYLVNFAYKKLHQNELPIYIMDSVLELAENNSVSLPDEFWLIIYNAYYNGEIPPSVFDEIMLLKQQ